MTGFGVCLCFLACLAVTEFHLAGRLWICRRCDERCDLDTIYALEATSSPIAHLQKKHKIAGQSRPSESSESEGIFVPPAKRPRYAKVAQVKETQELAVGFIVNSDQPFGIFTDKYLAELLYRFDGSLASQIPWSRSSMRRQLEVVFEEKRNYVRDSLRLAVSKIHLAFDLWTSSNNFAIMAISSHYLDSKGIQQQRLLALTRQVGAHTGENLAATLFRVIKEWDIQDRVGTLISDNALNNDTCTLAFFRQINPIFSDVDILERRMRCYGHILNLVGRAFFHGEDLESFEEESQRRDTSDSLQPELRAWRQKGPVGKLKNIIKFIRSSPQRSESFRQLAKESDVENDWLLHQESTTELQLILSNNTHWNSTYVMIDRAIKKKNHIQSFLVQQMDEGDACAIPPEAHLTAEDWRLLVELKAVVEPLYLQTMRCQGWGEKGSFGYLWEVLTGMEFLLHKMEGWRIFFDEPADEEILQSQSYLHYQQSTRRGRRSLKLITQALPAHVRDEYTSNSSSQSQRLPTLSDDSRSYLRLSITNAWQKLNQYYTKLGDSPLFAAAIILHPGRSLRWLEDRWDTGDQLTWLQDAREGLEQYWATWYRDGTPTSPSKPHSRPPSRRQPTETSTQAEEIDEWMNSTVERLQDRATDLSELERYLRLDLPVRVDDPIQWWLDRKQQFPTLSQLALDLFSIPAMAADCERTFSLAKLTLTSQRLSMDPRTLELIQCLKNWLRRNAITLGGIHFTLTSLSEAGQEG